jgi:DNA primase
MARIPEHIIETIRESSDIYDIVSEYVALKKRGRNFFGLCPFHDEKTPSFSINMDKQIYKCFGCGKGGGTINFIMDLERLDFIDALKFLGNKYNINIEIDHNSKSSNDLFNQLYHMNELANDYYKTQINEKVKNILAKRNINQNSIEIFNIGLSTTKYDDLLNIIRKHKFSSEALTKSGLFLDNEKGYMDRFRERIIFPIHNHFNKIVGFAGRIYTDNNKTAKYMNSPETPIYNKSKILYGLNLNKNAIIDSKSVIVVEGYLDLIQLYQAGITNVVAVSGTAFTEGHATAISKLCKTIYLAYDADKAGQEAAIRAGYIILKNNMEPKIICMPDGLDPDDWIQNEGPEPFKKEIQKASELIKFHWELSSKSFETEQNKIDFVNKVILDLMNIENPLNLELAIKNLAEITGFNINSILQTIKINESKKNKYKKRTITQKTEPVNHKHNIPAIEKELINFCFTNDLKLRTIIKNNLNTEWLESNLIKEIYKEIYMHLSSEETVKPEIIMNELIDENVRNLMAQLIFDDMEPNQNIVIDCLCRIEKNTLQKNINQLRLTLKNENLNEKEKIKNLEKIAEYQKNKNTLIDKYKDV